MSRAEDLRAMANEIIEEVTAERRAELEKTALRFGPDAVRNRPASKNSQISKASKAGGVSLEPAERLVVDAYWRWMARAKGPAGRNGRGRFAGDPDFNQKTFLEQFCHYLVEGDHAVVRHRVDYQNWTTPELAAAKKALQRLLKKHPRDGK
jgi:hypothetical protein